MSKGKEPSRLAVCGLAAIFAVAPATAGLGDFSEQAALTKPQARAFADRPHAGAPVPCTDYAFSGDADFDRGTLLNVNHDPPSNNQLQLNRATNPLPFINVAASARGTIVRIDVNTGTILGEYLTAPDGMARNPSRTTVDQVGDVWVANRDESGFSGGQDRGSIARVGLIIGGSRTDANGTVNPNGQYLKPPFQYSTCKDRDGDGLIMTSRELGNILPWANADSVDSDGGISSAQDECIINYTRVAGTNTRTVAVDANNDLWVGGLGNREHEKVSGVSGLPVPGTQFNLGCGGYGGLIDSKGVLWSSGAPNGGPLLRYDSNSKAGTCLTGLGDYGLGIDPLTGEIWHTWLGGDSVCKIAPSGALVNCYSHGEDFAQGVTVDSNHNVWVAHSLVANSTTVGHLRTDGTFVGNVDLPGGAGPTGVAVDANGKIWVANVNSDNAMRIDPNAGPVGGGGFKVGAVDLTVDLGAGAGPYNYSDMTGFVAIGSTSPQGTWAVRQDSGSNGAYWAAVRWNTEPQGTEPPGTAITVDARAAETEAGLGGQTFTVVTNGTPTGLSGRFIEVRATLKASVSGLSPVLSDLSMRACGPPPCETDADCDDGNICTTNTCDPQNPSADIFGCVSTSVTCQDDDNPCTTATCDPLLAGCTQARVPDGTPCSGGTCLDGTCATCTEEADFDLLTVCRPMPPCPGGTVNCDIHVRNRGPCAAPHVQVAMDLTNALQLSGTPEPLMIYGPGDNLIGTGGMPTVNGQHIEWPADNVPAGGKVATWFTLNAGAAGGTKTVSVSSPHDPSPANNTDTQAIIPDAALCLPSDFAQKTVDPDGPVCRADALLYLIAFQHPGASSANLVDVLDACLDPSTVGALMPEPQCVLAGHTIACAGMPLDANGRGVVSFAAQPKLGCAVGSTIENRVTVTFDDRFQLASNSVSNSFGECTPSAATLRAGNANLPPGGRQVPIPIFLDNSVSVRGLQFVLTDAPDEVRLTASPPSCATAARSNGIACDCNEVNGAIRCVLLSIGAARITPGSGQIATVFIDDAAPSCTQGRTSQLILSETAIADDSNHPVSHTVINGTLPCGCDCDLNCSERCDIFDALICVDLILGRDQERCSDGDLDGNHRTDIFDCLLIVDSIIGRRPGCS